MSRIAMVTGSSSGIGKGTALCLAKAGYDIAVNYAGNADGAQDCAERVRALGRKAVVFQADISKVENIRDLFKRFDEHFDHIDLLVNNAGITRMKPFLETDEEMFESVINTDFRGAYFCAQEACRRMADRGEGGVVINISSNHSIGCWPNSTAYAAGKAAMNKFTMNCAMEMSAYGIRVVGIAPGYTLLPEATAKRGFDENHEGYKRTSARIPMNRFAKPEDIGEAVVFLASEAASYITGTTLFIDGGALLPVVAQNTYV